MAHSFLRTLCALVALLGIARAQGTDDEFSTSLPSDPVEYVAAVRRELAKHKYFSKVLLVEDGSAAPTVMLLQKPQVEPADWQTSIAAVHAGWLEKTRELFQTTFVVPAQLQRRADTPVDIVCVLQSQGDFINYSDAVGVIGFYGDGAHFERRWHVVTAMHASGKLPVEGVRRGECAEFVRALLHAHQQGPAGGVLSNWFTGGIGGFLVDHAGKEPASLDQRAPHPEIVAYLVQLVGNEEWRAIYLQPLAWWLRQTADNAYWNQCHRTAQDLGAEVGDNAAWFAIHAQAALWMHFLHDANEGKYRAQFLKFVAGVLQGRGQLEAFQGAFAGLDPNLLDREFYRWVLARHRAAKPAEALDDKVVDLLFKAPAPSAGGASNSTPSTVAGDPTSLAPPTSDELVALGLALQRIRAGEVDGASKDLEQLAQRAAGGALERRVARELDRARRWIALRDACLKEFITSGEKRTLELGGKKVIAKIAKVENGRVLLGENRQKVESVGLEVFTPFVIARDLPKTLVESPDGWMRNYAFVLEGDERWKRGLQSGPEDATLLRADAEEWMPGVLRLGLAARTLAELAALGKPADKASAEAWIARACALKKQFGDLTLVSERAEVLRGIAADALGHSFALDSFLTGLHAVVERLDGGRVRVRYDFKDAVELADFVREPGYMGKYRSGMSPLLRSEEQTKLRVSNGAVRGNGSICYRLPISFSAPLVVRYGLQFGGVPPNGTNTTWASVLVCDDGKGNQIGCHSLGGITVDDASTKTSLEEHPDSVTIDPEHEYALEVRVSAARVATFVDSNQIQELPIGARTRGEIVLMIHSDPEIAFTRLEIEGALDPTAARERWVAARLTELGL